jgi:hypothetical protein
MASQTPEVPTEFRCFICSDWISQPVMVVCGDVFCYTCLKRFYTLQCHAGTPPHCVVCRTAIETEPLRIKKV